MKLISKSLFVLFTLVFLSSCDLGDDQETCYYVAGVGTTAVTGPETADVNEEISFNVTFKVAGNCGSFLQFFEAETGNEIKITVNAKYEGCDCDGVETTRTAVYKFKATSPGIYKLIFKKTNTEFITKTITVE